jgi:hypothetical protein
MSATEHSHPTADFAAVSLQRLHDSTYWQDSSNEWLPRRAVFELQIGPSLGFSRVWRAVNLSLQSGPGYLYRYFPFLCVVYVDGRPQTALEFDAPLQQQCATLRLPVGVPVRLTLVTELAHIPASSGHGADTRELALRFLGVTLGEGLAQAPRCTSTEPREHYELDARAASEETPRPIFVVGAYRSGTSVLTWALGQHPNIWPMEESGWIPPLADAAILGYRNAKTAARSFFDVYDVNRREYCAQIGYAVDRFCRNASRRHLHGILLGRLSERAEGFNPEYQLARSVMNPKLRWIDGTPENSGYITSLRSIFPFARFVAPLRNPLDVVASMLRFERAGGETRGVKAAAEMWLGITRRVLLAYQAFGPDVVHLVPYEALVRETAVTLWAIFDFLGEPNFPKAVETFSKRINSSQISGDERAALYKEIDAEADVKAEMLALYEELTQLIGEPWQADADALRQLTTIEENRIGRLALEYRGGVPLP